MSLKFLHLMMYTLQTWWASVGNDIHVSSLSLVQESGDEDPEDYYSDEDSAPGSKRRREDEVCPNMVSWGCHGYLLSEFL